MGKDYYDILGLSKNASEEEIKKAYRKKALQFHPDKSKDENSEEKFKEVGEAYEILSDSEKKSAYDRHRSRNAQFHAYTFRATRDPFDLFQTFFGGKDPFSDIFASVFAQHGEFCQHPSQNSKFVSKHFLKVRSRGASESADPSAKTTVEEQVGEGGTVHITKTIFSGDGSVRREMRFRTQSADSRVTQRLGDSEKIIDRQISAPSGYVSSTSPIVIKRVQIKKEEPASSSAPTTDMKKPFETATATATIRIDPPQARASRIKINVVKPEENKENLTRPAEKPLMDDCKPKSDPKIHIDKVTLSLKTKS